MIFSRKELIMYYQFQDMFTNMIFIWLIPVVLLSLIILSLYMIRKNRKENAAINILKSRLANGEIDNDEYIKMKRIIED